MAYVFADRPYRRPAFSVGVCKGSLSPGYALDHEMPQRPRWRRQR